MEEVEELKRQVAELKDTVENLKKATIKIETNTAKLSRMKSEIIRDVFPRDLLSKMNASYISELKQNVGVISNELFFMQTEYEYESYKRMAELIFNRPEPEKRLEAYLGIYRRVCEFMAEEYKNFRPKYS